MLPPTAPPSMSPHPTRRGQRTLPRGPRAPRGPVRLAARPVASVRRLGAARGTLRRPDAPTGILGGRAGSRAGGCGRARAHRGRARPGPARGDRPGPVVGRARVAPGSRADGCGLVQLAGATWAGSSRTGRPVPPSRRPGPWAAHVGLGVAGSRAAGSADGCGRLRADRAHVLLGGLVQLGAVVGRRRNNRGPPRRGAPARGEGWLRAAAAAAGGGGAVPCSAALRRSAFDPIPRGADLGA